MKSPSKNQILAGRGFERRAYSITCRQRRERIPLQSEVAEMEKGGAWSSSAPRALEGARFRTRQTLSIARSQQSCAQQGQRYVPGKIWTASCSIIWPPSPQDAGSKSKGTQGSKTGQPFLSLTSCARLKEGQRYFYEIVNTLGQAQGGLDHLVAKAIVSCGTRCRIPATRTSPLTDAKQSFPPSLDMPWPEESSAASIGPDDRLFASPGSSGCVLVEVNLGDTRVCLHRLCNDNIVLNSTLGLSTRFAS